MFQKYEWREKNRDQMINQVGQNVNYRWLGSIIGGSLYYYSYNFSVGLKLFSKKFFKYWPLCQLLKGIQLHQAPECPFSEGLVNCRKVLHHQQAALHGQLSGLTSNRTLSPGDPPTAKPSWLVPLSSWNLLPFIVSMLTAY